MKNKMPIYQLMDIAKQEVGSLVSDIMEKNNMPAGLMQYVLCAVVSEVKEKREIQDSYDHNLVVEQLNALTDEREKEAK
jgi:hypothetical protein